MGLIIDTSVLIAAEKKKLILDELLDSELNCIASVTLTWCCLTKCGNF